MSYEIGIDTLHLRPTPRLAHTEYFDHQPYVQRVVDETGRDFHEAWDYDLCFHISDGPVAWWSSDQLVDMGHAEYQDRGTDFRPAHEGMFNDVDDVHAFDVNETFELTPFDELVAFYQDDYRKGQAHFSSLVFPGGYYNTIV
jgi:hypothetical protein